MAYDDQLAIRIRQSLGAHPNFSERRMFGGICFLLNGNMTAGVLGPSLILRVGPDRHQEMLTKPHVRTFAFTGRPSKGIVYVDPPGIKTDRALAAWLEHAVAFVATLPRKEKAPQVRASRRPPSRKVTKPR